MEGIIKSLKVYGTSQGVWDKSRCMGQVKVYGTSQDNGINYEQNGRDLRHNK